MTKPAPRLSAQNQERTRISDSEVAELLEQPHPCILSMSREKRGPIATPLWYEFRDGRFFLGLLPQSAKGKLLTRTGCATITIQRPVEPYLYVMVEGEARFLTEEELAARGDTVWSVMHRIFKRYLNEGLADRYAKVLPVLAPDYRIIEVTPRAVRGESLRYHEDVIPKEEEIPALIESANRSREEGKSIEEVREGILSQETP